MLPHTFVNSAPRRVDKAIVTTERVVSAGVSAAAFRIRSLYDQIGRVETLSIVHDDEEDEPTREMVRQEVREMLAAISAAQEKRREPTSR
jgi:hypothetical protein